MTSGIIVAVRTRLDGRRQSDAGVALVVVLSVILVLTILVTAGAAFAVKQRSQVRDNQDWQAALAAAQAGVDDYTSKLNQDSIYWKYGRTSSYCTGCTFLNTGPSVSNTAFAGWTTIVGVTGRGQFRYDVDNSLYPTRGIVKLRASGKSGSEIRTIEVQVRRGGFIDFLYFTDYELLDPTVSGSSCTPQYWYDNTSRCGTNITFIPADSINGPAHSNDAMLMCTGTRSGTPNNGPVFNDRISTGYDGSLTSGRKWRRSTSSGCSSTINPYFKVSGDPRGPVILPLPPSNTDYIAETNPAVTTPTGCRYTGPTKIVLNSNGTMTVTSPATKNPHPVAGCANGSTTGQTVNIPTSGIVYVQNVPATADQFTKTPNTTSACTTSSGRVTNNGVGYPIANEDQTQEAAYRYSCTNGDVFLSGSMNGRLTLAAENNIVAVNDITYAGGVAGDDLLGLVPNQSVLVYHPVNSSRNNITIPGRTAAPNTFTIQAAMFAVNKSIRVMNWDEGNPLGTLTIYGSMAQKFRGPVGTNSGGSVTNGYTKDYNYDYRLAYDAPPKFLGPVVSPFIATLWTENVPAYSS